jgi:hypothetical protein
VSEETPEMESAYANAKVGDPAIFVQRMDVHDPHLDVQYCGFEWTESPFDPPLEGDVWGCTRSRGHKPPHVAEGFSGVLAIHGTPPGQ